MEKSKSVEQLVQKGNLSLAKKDYKKASNYFQKAIKIDPGHVVALNNQGASLVMSGDLKAAEYAYKASLKANPKFSDSHYGLGAIALMQNKNSASTHFKKALLYQPDHLKSLIGLRQCLLKNGDLTQLTRVTKKILSLEPNNARLWGELGAALLLKGRQTEAYRAFKRAILLNPDLPSVYYNLATYYQEKGLYKKAISLLNKAIKIDPNFKQAIQSLYFLKRETADWKDIEKSEKMIESKIFDSHFTSILRTDNPAHNYHTARIASKKIEKSVPSHLYSYHFKHKKIRLGYISSDFRNHPVGQMVVPIFKHHDKNKFEVYVFSKGEDDNSTWRKEAENAEHFIDIRKLTPQQSAKLINDNHIDILIDSTGPMAFSPMLVMAFRPAPIQVSWMGILGTTGAKFYDYILGDKYVTPKKHYKHYTENIVQLPCFSWINQEYKYTDKILTRKDFGLPEEVIVFASFSLPIKIEPVIFSVWMEILNQVPKSILWLWKRNNEVVANLRKYAQQKNIDPARLIFYEKIAYEKHLSRMSLADIILDTWIYQGAQTASSAISSGSPFLTIQGNHFISIVSASMLYKLGLKELVAKNLYDYQKKAIELGLDSEKLDSIKQKIQHCLVSNSYTSQDFVKDMEEAYIRMYKRLIAGKQPTQIIIK